MARIQNMLAHHWVYVDYMYILYSCAFVTYWWGAGKGGVGSGEEGIYPLQLCPV